MFSSDGQRPFFSSSQERRFRGYVLSLSLSPFLLPHFISPVFLHHPDVLGVKKMFVCMINVCLYDFGGRWYKKREKKGPGVGGYVFIQAWLGSSRGEEATPPNAFLRRLFCLRVSLDTTTVGLHFTYTSYYRHLFSFLRKNLTIKKSII